MLLIGLPESGQTKCSVWLKLTDSGETSKPNELSIWATHRIGLYSTVDIVFDGGTGVWVGGVRCTRMSQVQQCARVCVCSTSGHPGLRRQEVGATRARSAPVVLGDRSRHAALSVDAAEWVQCRRQQRGGRRACIKRGPGALHLPGQQRARQRHHLLRSAPDQCAPLPLPFHLSRPLHRPSFALFRSPCEPTTNSYTRAVVFNLGYSCHLWHFDQKIVTLSLFYVTLLIQKYKENDT